MTGLSRQTETKVSLQSFPPPPLKFPPRPCNKFPALLVDKGYKRGGNYADKMSAANDTRLDHSSSLENTWH